MKIVVLDGYTLNPGDLSWEGLQKLGDVTIYDRTAAGEIIDRTKDAEVVLTNKVPFDAKTIGSLPKLKYIGVLATGYNVVDTEAARSHGVVVTNIPAYSTDSVVQMTFAHMLNLTSQIAHYSDEVRNGKWTASRDFTYWDTPLPELSAMTLGVVGLGHIGMKVARIARAFGMDVFAATRKNSASLPDGIMKTTLDGLYSTADILTLHCPLTDSTREMINRETIAKMKPGILLINTGRGQLVNEADLAEALESGQVGGYAADVLSTEPAAADCPLLHTPNTYLTPHIAWATLQARQRLMDIATANVEAFIAGNAANVVNA